MELHDGVIGIIEGNLYDESGTLVAEVLYETGLVWISHFKMYGLEYDALWRYLYVHGKPPPVPIEIP